MRKIPTEAGQAIRKTNGSGQVHRTAWRDYAGKRYLSTACGTASVSGKTVVDPEGVPEHRACWNCWGRTIRERRAAEGGATR